MFRSNIIIGAALLGIPLAGCATTGGYYTTSYATTGAYAPSYATTRAYTPSYATTRAYTRSYATTGTSTTRYATTAPLPATVRAAPRQNAAAAGHRYDVFPHENDANFNTSRGGYNP